MGNSELRSVRCLGDQKKRAILNSEVCAVFGDRKKKREMGNSELRRSVRFASVAPHFAT